MLELNRICRHKSPMTSKKESNKISLEFQIKLHKMQIAKNRYALHRTRDKGEKKRIEKKILELMKELRKLQKGNNGK